MKRYIIFTSFVTLLTMAMVVSCKKSTTDPNNNNNNNNTPTACNGKTLCFKLDGTLESHDAEWKKIPANSTNPARYRIYWEDNGTPYKNIEMDIYASAVGVYNVADKSTYTANDASFQYFVTGAKTKYGKSGTIEITSIDNSNNTITGKFTITAADSTNTYQVTEGNFVNVPLK